MENKNNKDILFRIKYLGYFLAGYGADRPDVTFSDLVRISKFNLSEARNVLMEDPIWDKYNDYQILQEYYAMYFRRSEEAREAFKIQLENDGNLEDEGLNWMNKEIEKNRSKIEEMKALSKQEEEILDFDPEKE